MIIVNRCIDCSQTAQEIQPIGWVRVSIVAAARKPDEEEKRVIETQQQVYYFCGPCFEKWWKKS